MFELRKHVHYPLLTVENTAKQQLMKQNAIMLLFFFLFDVLIRICWLFTRNASIAFKLYQINRIWCTTNEIQLMRRW